MDFKELELQLSQHHKELTSNTVWPTLRIQVFYALRTKASSVTAAQTSHQFITRLKKFSNIFYGILNLFKRRPYLIFSASNENKLVSGKLQNKLFLPIYKSLGLKNILYFETPFLKHCPLYQNGNPTPCSTTIFEFFAALLSIGMKNGRTPHKIMMTVKQKCGVDFDMDHLIRRVDAHTIIFRYFLLWKKPKIIFLSDSYAILHAGLIRAAKSLQIPVVEIQHGVINYEHPAYNHYNKIRNYQGYYPDYLLTYGPMVLKEIGASSFIPPKKIISCGHPYLDYLNNEVQVVYPKPKKITIAVTLQWTDEDRVIPFIISIAQRRPEISFILIPRVPTLDKYNIDVPINVRVEKIKDFYSVIRQDSTIHCTTYSTCALEAVYIGIPNILINFDDMATKYFGKLMPASDYNIYVKEISEFENAIDRLKFTNSENVRSQFEYLYSYDYQKNFELFKKTFLE